MGIFSNIIRAAATVAGAEGGWVEEQDGPHFTVAVTRGGGKAEVQVSVIGSGDLAPADHYGAEDYSQSAPAASAAPASAPNPWAGYWDRDGNWVD